MAFAYTIEQETVFGNLRVVTGTYDLDGVATGEIVTGLNSVVYADCRVKAAAVSDTVPVLNEDFPLVGGDLTIVGTDGMTGNFIALGL